MFRLSQIEFFFSIPNHINKGYKCTGVNIDKGHCTKLILKNNFIVGNVIINQ